MNPADPPPPDPRLAAFCDPDAPEVFSAIVHGSQVWSDDPFDVDTIHAEARAAFRRLLDRASSTEGLPPTGKTLLLLGEAGSGKTHLMRAFRAEAHTHGYGYCGYLQMTSRSDNYARYVLANLIDSLEQPYRTVSHTGPPTGPTALSRLARGVLDAVSSVSLAERERLVDGGLELEEMGRLVHRMSSAIVQYPRFAGIDVEIVRALLYLLVDDGLVHALAIKWLRCEDLSRYDREVLGDLVPRTSPEMPLRTIVALGRLMWAVHSAALVLLVDQIEEVVELSRGDTDPGAVLRGAINTLVDVADGLPSAVVVVACLDDLFSAARAHLPGPKLDRLERDPEPVSLVANRSADEVEALVGRRMQVLLDDRGVDSQRDAPAYPFRADQLAALAGLRTRDVLDACRRHRERCVDAGRWVEPERGAARSPIASEPAKPAVVRLGQAWNDFLAEWAQATLAEATMIELVHWVAGAAQAELPEAVTLDARRTQDLVAVAATVGGVRESWVIAVCEASSRGGGLGRRLDEVVSASGGRPMAFVRSTAFPRDTKTKVALRLAELCKPRGASWRVVVQNAEWRAMEAFRAFSDQRHAEPGFAAWVAEDHPLTRLGAVRAILDLDHLEALAAKVVPAAPRGRDGAPPSDSAGTVEGGRTLVPLVEGPIRLGHTRGLVARSVDVDPATLTRHAALLGGSGSGKTTAAMVLVEGLLVRGVPVVLIDRKGDLCRYADPDAWTATERDAARASRRDDLRARIDVALYTPGNPDGRPAVLPIAPDDLHQMPESEREQLAEYAAGALCGMMGYRSKSSEPKRAILQKAIEVLGRTSKPGITVPALQQLVSDRDHALLTETAGLDDRHFKALAEDLQTLWLRHRRLLDGGEPLDLDKMLGRGGGANGRTPLTIVSTLFLGDDAAADFWVSQLLLALERWRGRSPSDRLQAVILFDEADRYLPAAGRIPTTKAAMENLLKRARSAGLGVLLATQSPGDLDYKCRDQVLTWIIGRVKEKTALAKLRPMLDAARIEPDKLPPLSAGQFQLVREAEGTPIEVDLNLIAMHQVPEDRIAALAAATTPRG